MLRHTLATLAYRGEKATRNAPQSFAGFQAGATTRTPGEILAHICDLLDWLYSQASGDERWHNTAPGTWDDDCARFHAALALLDDYLAGVKPLGATAERLFQGGIADAFTHVGQIALLRRLAGTAIRGENYSKAEITAGRLGREQSSRRIEFD
jgi:hypothetical protein